MKTNIQDKGAEENGTSTSGIIEGIRQQPEVQQHSGYHAGHEGMLMYGKEASNRKQEIDRQHYTIPNQRPKDKHCGKI